MKNLHMITYTLVIIGGLNWLLFGIFGADLGSWVLGGMDSMLARVVYILVGVSAVIELMTCKKNCKAKKGMPANNGMNQGM